MSDTKSRTQNQTEKVPPTIKRRFVRTGLIVLCVYLAFIGILTWQQRNLIYHPRRASNLQASEWRDSSLSTHDFQFETVDGLTLNGWHYLRSGTNATDLEECRELLKSSDLAFLYFQGNAGHRGFRTTECSLLAMMGADVLIADYRGFGDNPSSPTQELLVADAHALWKYAVETCEIPPERIAIYGESLGGGVACQLAADLCETGHPPCGLIIEASFSSLADVAKDRVPIIPVDLILMDPFRSDRRMPLMTAPYLHLHGEDDRVVPYEIGKRLFDSAPATSTRGVEKRFLSLSGTGHNDIYENQSSSIEAKRAIQEFFDRIRDR